VTFLVYCTGEHLFYFFSSFCFTVFSRSRSSDDLLDIDFSQTSFPSQSSDAGSQRNSLHLSPIDMTTKAETEQLKSQSAVDLRSSAGTLPSSSSIGV